MKSFHYLLRRELWEHRAFWIAPLALAGLALLLGLASLATLTYLNYAVHNGGVAFDQPEHPSAALNGFLLGASAPFNFIMLIVIAAFLLSTLVGERRDRSILFWKSLPISDTASVLSKLTVATLVAPAILLGIVIGVEILLGIIYVIAFVVNGLNPWLTVAHPLVILGAWVTLAYALIAQSLWYLPFYGWFLLASAWARHRSAFLWAVLPPFVAIIIEGWVFHSAIIVNAIVHHLGGLFPLVFKFNLGSGAFTEHSFGSRTSSISFASVGHFFSSPELWIGVAIGIIFVAGAIGLRHYRDEV